MDQWLGLCASTTGSTAESMAGNKDPAHVHCSQKETEKNSSNDDYKKLQGDLPHLPNSQP